MGKGSSAPTSQRMPRFSGKGGVASPAPQNPYASQQAPQSQYASPLSGLGAIYGQYQQPSAQQTMSDYSGDSYTGGSPEFPEVFYPSPSPPPPPSLLPPQYQQPNPYAMPFQQRYVQQFNPAPTQFVPQSAKNYRSPFQGSGKGKGNRGEQTYFDRTQTAPTPAPAPTPTPPIAPAPSYYDDGSWLGASGGVIKAAAGRYLQGPGDGTSDSIPATIGNAQPARLADGEFVIDARTVSEIGNGSSNAGAKKLYAMMERVHRERKKAKRGQDSNADRFLPA